MSEAAVLFSLKLTFAVAAVIAVAWFVVRPMWKLLREKPDVDFMDPMAILGDEEVGEELEIPTGGKKGKPERSEIISQARQDPRAVATAISRWLQEKK